ncbi:hypothetical protein C7447_101152 [Tenacibaculum adriaticum]|uniref:Uncharacterized protein n=1 Tax=Tenacibaculum adriaticum TaxID=413713 RepID=A0A5S5DXM8_9FLAO|nr:hypothetical protein [Tenacibaculum adriaticum]TYP99552.1 hypothetical protein C7447_101152 [Tenacibaculum adriaticum]
MTYNLTTYRTITGKKQILETKKKKSTEAIIYQDGKPAFFVDCFDLQTESNVIMNSLVLCQQRSMNTVIKEIAQKNNINLSIKGTPLFVIKKTSEIKELELPPLPEEWLN